MKILFFYIRFAFCSMLIIPACAHAATVPARSTSDQYGEVVTLMDDGTYRLYSGNGKYSICEPVYSAQYSAVTPVVWWNPVLTLSQVKVLLGLP